MWSRVEGERRAMALVEGLGLADGDRIDAGCDRGAAMCMGDGTSLLQNAQETWTAAVSQTSRRAASGIVLSRRQTSRHPSLPLLLGVDLVGTVYRTTTHSCRSVLTSRMLSTLGRRSCIFRRDRVSLQCISLPFHAETPPLLVTWMRHNHLHLLAASERLLDTVLHTSLRLPLLGPLGAPSSHTSAALLRVAVNLVGLSRWPCSVFNQLGDSRLALMPVNEKQRRERQRTC